METLENFFRKLAQYEGTPTANLIAPWKPSSVTSITNAFSRSRQHARIEFSVERDLSVPALGKRIEDAVAAGLQPHLGNYQLWDCAGQGYPDRRLERRKDRRSFAFELKAKTKLDPTDTQRMILTSGTRKLRHSFKAGEPICHLLATALYSSVCSKRRRQVIFHGLYLAFLEPWTLVQNQYEASVNQRLLANGDHSRRLVLWGEHPRDGAARVTARNLQPEDCRIVLS